MGILLHPALFALRSSPNAAIRESPHFLVYGRDPRFPFETLTELQRINYSIDTDYQEELILAMKQAFEVARINSKKAALKSAKQYNKTAKAVTYKVGDEVYLKKEAIPKGKNKKFAYGY